jgi:hypothetical protein
MAGEEQESVVPSSGRYEKGQGVPVLLATDDAQPWMSPNGVGLRERVREIACGRLVEATAYRHVVASYPGIDCWR